MPETKSTSNKSTVKKNTSSSTKPKTKTTKINVKSDATIKSVSTKPKAKTSAPKAAKAVTSKSTGTKTSPKLTDVKPAKTSTKKPATTKPSTKKSGKAIDSFTIPTDRSKTTAGNTDMDFDDLEKRVENYDTNENIAEEKPKRTEKTVKSRTAKLASKPIKSSVSSVPFYHCSYLLAAPSLVP